MNKRDEAMLNSIRLRQANQEDVSFIFNSWLKSYRNSLFAKNIPNEIYFTNHHNLVENLLQNNKVIIACSKEDPSQIYGYICAGHTDGILTLHYIYIKQTFRNMGIAKQLLSMFNHDSAIASVYTHHTRIAEKLGPKYNMFYHPYLLVGEDAEEAIEAEESGESDA